MSAPDTIPELVRAVAARGDRLAVVDGEQQVSFAALSVAVEEAARGWMALGIERGDRVAIWAPNSWKWQGAAPGAQAAGAALVPPHTRRNRREPAYFLEPSGAPAPPPPTPFLAPPSLTSLPQPLPR